MKILEGVTPTSGKAEMVQLLNSSAEWGQSGRLELARGQTRRDFLMVAVYYTGDARRGIEAEEGKTCYVWQGLARALNSMM